MAGLGIISLLIIFITVLVSYKGFGDELFYERYKFEVEKILVYKDYKRLVTSGFLHVGWMHLLFNMLSLYFFSGSIETYLGPFKFLLIYFTGIIGGDLFSLLVHKNHGDYTSVGASGGVCAIIFASIALFPGFRIGLFFIPISFPAWIYGIAFILYSIYAIKSRKDNIGNDAHLGGALAGMLLAILMVPSSLVNNLLPILLITLPCIFFIYIIITRPQFLLIDNYFFKTHNKLTIDEKYNIEKTDTQKEVDRILEKIHKKGMKSLTAKEREILNEYSNTP